MFKAGLTRHQRNADRMKAGIPFGSSKILHHHAGGEPIVCEDAREHGRLEREKRVIEADGKVKCKYCKKYDDPKNLVVRIYDGRPTATGYHKECRRLYYKDYYRRCNQAGGRSVLGTYDARCIFQEG